jgi:hypothetical protein
MACIVDAACIGDAAHSDPAKNLGWRFSVAIDWAFA